jgi:hypothetical protein
LYKKSVSHYFGIYFPFSIINLLLICAKNSSALSFSAEEQTYLYDYVTFEPGEILFRIASDVLLFVHCTSDICRKEPQQTGTLPLVIT